MKHMDFQVKGILLGAGLLLAGAGTLCAEAEAIGRVDRVESRVTASLDTQVRDLAPDAPLYFGEQLASGPAARLEATLADDTKITLGENAVLSIDEFVYTPGTEGGALAMRVLEGTFLFVGGKVEAPTGGNVAISTPFATLGIRGTTVWGGPLDGAFAVLVVEGEVQVTNAGKTVTLTKDMGTTLADAASQPQDPVKWPEAKVERAFETVAFAP